MTLACGVDRVLFGTDFPVAQNRRYLDLFEKEHLDEETTNAILYKNAKRMFQV